MAGPSISIVFKPKEKGAKSERVIAIWKNQNDHGEWLSATPKMDADNYGMSLPEALEKYAAGDGYLNVYVNEAVSPPEDF